MVGVAVLRGWFAHEAEAQCTKDLAQAALRCLGFSGRPFLDDLVPVWTALWAACVAYWFVRGGFGQGWLVKAGLRATAT